MAELMTRKGHVVVHALVDLHVGGRVLVAGQQSEDIVGAALLIALGDIAEHQERMDRPVRVAMHAAGLGNDREIRRQRAVLSGARLLVVEIGPEDRDPTAGRDASSSWPSLPASSPASFIRGSGLATPRRASSPPLPEIPDRRAPTRLRKRQPLQAVTGRADFLVDLEAALQLRLVELAFEAGERPRLAFDFMIGRRQPSRPRRRRASSDGNKTGDRE